MRKPLSFLDILMQGDIPSPDAQGVRSHKSGYGEGDMGDVLLRFIGQYADVLGLGSPPCVSLHYYILQPLDFLHRKSGRGV